MSKMRSFLLFAFSAMAAVQSVLLLHVGTEHSPIEMAKEAVREQFGPEIQQGLACLGGIDHLPAIRQSCSNITSTAARAVISLGS